MDGGRRLLDTMTGAFSAFLPARLKGDAGTAGLYGEKPVRQVAKLRPAPRRRAPRRSSGSLFSDLAARRGFGSALALTFLLGCGGYGLVRGGQYDAFVAEAGRPADFIGRMLGFGITTITLSGQRELTHAELVQASGVTARDSVLFLDAHAVRQRLKAMPLVREATVRKLYPDQVVFAIVERTPHALWQLDGEVSVIAADGAAIDRMRDQRFARLPFVVGAGANERVADYLRILEAAGEFRTRISAGVLVGQRRWNLKLGNGVDVRLPERDPEAAVARLAALARTNKLADKDIVAIDMRLPDRIVVRLSEEAAAQRLEARSKKPRPKGSAA